MYQRVVCFKFVSGATEESIQHHLDRFKQLKSLIPQIVSYSGGRVVASETHPSLPYDTVHYVTFASLADIDLYFHHEAHQRFIEENKPIWDNVLVLDSLIE
jgi:hypothetical protein